MRRRALAIAIVLASTLAYGTAAHAVAVYDARITTNLAVDVISPSGAAPVNFEGTGLVTNLLAQDTIGPATAAVDFTGSGITPADFPPGAIAQNVRASGSAAPSVPMSSSYAEGATVGSFYADTLPDATDAAETFEFLFTLDWTVFLTATVDDPVQETATAAAFLDLFAFKNDGLEGLVLGTDLGEMHLSWIKSAADLAGSNGTFSESGRLAFSTTLTRDTAVGLFETLGVDVVADAVGTASAVPEPGTLVLLGSGLLGLAGVSRRRKAE